nr:phage tail tape measure protein [Bacillus subtilis]
MERRFWRKYGCSQRRPETGPSEYQGLSDKDLKDVTKGAITLSETFDADVNEVTRAGNNIMKGFGVESQKAFDLMTYGAQKGLNFSNEMFDNLSEYAPLFGKMGFSAEEYFPALNEGQPGRGL